MRKTILFTIALALSAKAQRIETEKSDRHKVIRVETALNHLSIVELAEPVTEVAAGSSSYKIEWRGNKAFVQPLDPEATTNLFIWTASGRLSYELVPGPSVEEMHFAIDQEPSPSVAKVAIPEKPVEDPRAVQEAKLASEMLFASTPVRLAGDVKNHDRVEVILKDIYREGDRLYVRYALPANSRECIIGQTVCERRHALRWRLVVPWCLFSNRAARIHRLLAFRISKGDGGRRILDSQAYQFWLGAQDIYLL
jgi:hypothetical protein